MAYWRKLAITSLGLSLGGGLLSAAHAEDRQHESLAEKSESAVDIARSLTELESRTDAALARTDLLEYRGWLKYLRFEATTATKGGDKSGDAVDEKVRRLDEWLQRITANPGFLGTMRGVHEWAYESPADGSGQPFKIVIPTDYDPVHPAPLTVYMHGYGDNHLEDSTGMTAHPGSFEISVLGRSRAGGYRALSEADVLQAIDYVRREWAIDPDRIRLTGGSMGGGGTYRLGARYPQMWASARPACGYASYLPIGNLITLPIYATHSADDPTVSVLHDRGPLAKLRELGGEIVYDETNGFGHAVWNYRDGNARGEAWERAQIRPNSRAVRHVDYTALDGGAVRGWWAEVSEWGLNPGPARFNLTVGSPNLLLANLSNIRRLRIRIAESPFNRAEPLQVAVNGAVPFLLPAPLPETATLVLGEKGWGFESKAEDLPFRLHTPGSASLLYNGEPLLIVYGTRGNERERIAMHEAANAASKSSNPAWPDESGKAGSDGVPYSHNLYGTLNVKADVDIDDFDLRRCHLVLIGTASQNSVVARMADALPAKILADGIACSDGLKLSGEKLAMGLVFYDPLASRKLIFWVASNDPSAYAADNAITKTMAGGGAVIGNAYGADMLVTQAGTATLVVSRSFDSRWNWVKNRDSSPLAPASAATSQGFALLVSAAIRSATSADFAISPTFESSGNPPVTIGTTKAIDIAPMFANVPIGTFEMKGSAVIDLNRRLASLISVVGLCDFNEAKIVATKTYRISVPVSSIWPLGGALVPAPESYVLTEIDFGNAIAQYFGAE